VLSEIVVGTDGSETASAAVNLAVELARTNGATLHLVTAYKDPSAGPWLSGTPEELGSGLDVGTTVRQVKAACEETLAMAAKRAEGIAIQTHVVPGGAADVMVIVAEGVGADLIVVGSKGMQGARRLIGSVPNSVAHRAPCHVLIAKTT
jgi:nucleotide-binding universal stress UspA family protein